MVVHPDGGIWFTDPGYGSMGNYEGNKGALEIKEAVYRIDPKTGALTLVTDDALQAERPVLLARLQDALRGRHRRRLRRRGINVFDVVDGQKLANGRALRRRWSSGARPAAPTASAPTSTATSGSSAGWVGDGYDGVHVFAPDGTRIGFIKLPEICSNVCFGGPKRNRLFMTASQSLYAIYTEARGAL